MTRDWKAPELIEPAAAKAAGHRLWTPAVVLVLGAFSIAFLAATLWVTDREMAQNLAVERTVTDLQRAVAYWHLWLEEVLTGDRFVDLDRDVESNQRLALRLASMLLRGGERDNGQVIEPLRDRRLREASESLEETLLRLRRLSDDRLSEPAAGGVGTVLDQEFDRTFHEVKGHADELRRLQVEYLERHRERFRFGIGILVTIWSVIMMTAVAGLWNRERRRRQAEDALRASQRWLATTLSSIGDAVVTADLSGRVVFMNPRAEQLTGWPRSEASGRPVGEVVRLFREIDNHPIECPAAKVLQTGESVGASDHSALLDRSGRRCYGVDEGASPIRDDRGVILGVVMVFHDVSERRRTEKTLRQRETELHRALKMEAVGRLAGGLAHDVNNYLGAIRGCCEMAVMKDESGEALATRMGHAIATADKISALIQQLLAFSRRQPVKRQVVDLNRVVRDMQQLTERLLGDDVSLETRLSDDLWSVEVDPSQVEQVLVNLLVNARDAMPSGGTIVVATGNAEVGAELAARHPETVPGRYVRLTVRDTGHAIPPEVQEKIFDPFFSTKEDDSGSVGLGLATVYGIVHQHEGFLSFESVVGVGTAFDIYLPASDRRPADAEAGAVPVRRTGPLRVLLVEDNAAMRASTRELLEVQGHEVRTATNGKEALELVDGGPSFDLVITDVSMPKMGGPELHDVLRGRGIAVPFLFISGYAENVIPLHISDQDRLHFLHKPFSSEGLARKIGEALGGGE